MCRTVFYITFVSFLFLIAGCKKEYSCEACGTTTIMDTTTHNTPLPYICPGCIGGDDFIENKWSLSSGSSFYCGRIDTAIAAPARNGFTFFGPSSCSIDSGLVLTISTEPVILDKDVFNSTTTRVGMYYYDNVAQTYPFMTQPGFQFSVTIESYIYQTKMMTGKFNGIVVKPNGGQTNVQGKFKMKIR